MSVAQDVRDELRGRFAGEAKAQGLPYPQTAVPTRVSRYKRPPDPLLATSRSEIIELDTEGMDEDAFRDLLRVWFNYLKRSGRAYDIRLLVEVDIEEYFGEDGPDDPSVKSTLRGRKKVPLWIPPTRFWFARSRGDLAPAEFDDWYELFKGHVALTENKYGESYAGRLGQSGVIKVALIPYQWGDIDEPVKRSRKRKPRPRKRK
jgi:hypothetical protein